MNISVSEQEYATIKELADIRGESVSALILNAIREQIENWEDIRDAEEVLSRDEPVYPWKDVKKRAEL
jgi:predicted DNA-binding protein